MKLYALIVVSLLLSMLFLPLFSLLGGGGNENSASVVLSQKVSDSKEREEKTAQKLAQESGGNEKKEEKDDEKDETGETISVLRTESGEVTDTDMFSYTVGCIAGEMGPLFEPEALKAQAVVSYTYALYMKKNSSGKGSDLSDDSSVHQCFMTYSEMKEKWGSKYDEYIEILEKAVEDTQGEYLTYNSELIKPAYHAISSGKTNSAEEVWGGSIPYLVSRNSEGDKLAPDYISKSVLNEKQMKKALSEQGITQIKLGEIKKTDSGYVKSIDISGKEFSGEQLRQLLSLRSGSFSVTEKNGKYTFTCYGYGHGVGMSQWGANFMARRGFTYKEILKQYYNGVKIQTFGKK